MAQRTLTTKLSFLTFAAILTLYSSNASATTDSFDPYAASNAQGNFLKLPAAYQTKNSVVNAPPPDTTGVVQANPNSNTTPLPGNKDVSASQMDLSTKTGVEVGLLASYYRYQEHVIEHPEFMSEVGPEGGITLTGTQALGAGFFVMADSRFAYGQNHYSSKRTGTQNGLTDYLGEVRALAGKDFAFTESRLDVSPYIGAGYRNLFNDWSGTTSTGNHGYHRDSQYLYLPVGVTPRFRVADDARVSVNMEYDQLLMGWQTSYLSDFGSPQGDVTQKQNSGYGLHSGIMYERASWAAGPFFNYWNIDQSDFGKFGWHEPHNQTVESGLQARYRF